MIIATSILQSVRLFSRFYSPFLISLNPNLFDRVFYYTACSVSISFLQQSILYKRINYNSYFLASFQSWLSFLCFLIGFSYCLISSKKKCSYFRTLFSVMAISKPDSFVYHHLIENSIYMLLICFNKI